MDPRLPNSKCEYSGVTLPAYQSDKELLARISDDVTILYSKVMNHSRDSDSQ